MLRAMKAVMAAIKSAATSNMTFFLSMTNCPLKGPLIEECYFTQNG
jgi:predicted small lipoprotein YifL